MHEMNRGCCHGNEPSKQDTVVSVLQSGVQTESRNRPDGVITCFFFAAGILLCPD